MTLPINTIPSKSATAPQPDCADRDWVCARCRYKLEAPFNYYPCGEGPRDPGEAMAYEREAAE